MKALICLIMLLGLIISLSAEEYPIAISITGPTFYNVLRISSFDLQVPANQPLFFRVVANNITTENIDNPYLFFSLNKNSDLLIEPETRVRYKFALTPNQPLVFTNRDVITEVGSTLFDSPYPVFTALDVIENMPDFRDVILNTGLFPDGDYTFTVQFRSNVFPYQALSNEVSLTFLIRNPGGIFLINPGTILGGAIPIVSSLPVNFLWSSNLAASTFNPFRLIVKEFDDPYLLYPEFIETEGHTITDVEILTGTYYSDFVPLQEDRYYAWKIETPIIDPTLALPASISSPYNVFRYSTGNGYDNEGVLNAIRIYLLSLNIQWVTELLNSGFDPSGIIDYNGTIWSGTGAENMINELKNRPVIDVNLAE
ncbi:MAG: hypothetical protein K0B81_03985 [Candidatus Cloacimonetes bacterium]|nr:hypothetical protein [Candidatus Cloacimonadota bacterium]